MQHKSLIITVLATAMLGCLGFSSHALSSDFFPQESVLSKGHWVKIRVSETGMQQISHQQLRDWGFSDPSKVTVFGCGAAVYQRDIIDNTLGGDLPQQPVVYLDDKIVFFGESDVRTAFKFFSTNIKCGSQPIRNTASDAGYYFITDSQPIADPQEIAISSIGSSEINYHLCMQFYEEEQTNPALAGQRYFGHSLGADETLRLSFPMPDRYLTSSLGTIVVMNPVLIASKSANSFTFSVPRTISSETAIYEGTKTLSTPNDPTVLTYQVSPNDQYEYNMAESVTTLDYTLKRASASTDFAALDYFSFYYPRANRLADNAELTLCYNSVSTTNIIVVTDVTPDTRVWNIDQASNVRPHVIDYNADDATLRFSPATSYTVSDQDIYGMRTIVFDPTREHNQVEYAGEISNQNLHGMTPPNLLIISSDLCYEQALRLAEIHRSLLGQTVEVVRQQDIFNEFSSGAPTPAAYRHFAKMLYDRAPYTFKNILLFGGGSYDNRGLLPQNAYNFNAGANLMTFSTDNHLYIGTTSRSFTSDAYFGFLDDNFTPANLLNAVQTVNVGRIPVTDVSKAASVVDKIESYLTSIPSVDFNHQALLLADSGDNNAYLDYEEAVAAELSRHAPGITSIKGYNILYPLQNNSAVALRERIINALQNGVGYFNYSGHGVAASISEQVLWDNTFANSTDYDFYPYAMLASCDIYSFDRGTANLAETMLYKRNGGMIGIIAACRSVYASYNQTFNLSVATAYSSASETTTTGDIYRTARNTCIAKNSTDLAVNTLCYNFCGDPALPVYAATQNIQIVSVDGESFSESEQHAIAAHSPITIEGYISRSGRPDPLFTGRIIATLYEAPKEVSIATSTGSDTGTTVTLDEDIMVEAVGKVENGSFSFTITPPSQIREGSSNRLTLYAVSDDRTRFSKTYTTAFTMKFEDEAESSDNEPPVITDLYIDTPDFTDGDLVNGEFRLYATILPDQSGIKTSSASIGGTTRVTLDNSKMTAVRGTAMNIDTDGTVHISLPMSSIADGSHTLTLTTTDNAGNSASRSINFVVLNRVAQASLSVAESPARTEATISLDHTFAGEPTGRIIIEDAAGTHIYTREAVTFPFSWDLTGADGELVPDGVYSAYAILKDDTIGGSTPKVPIIVVQEQ